MEKSLKILVLYNETLDQVAEEHAKRQENLPFMDKSLPTPDEEFEEIALALRSKGHTAQIYNIEDNLETLIRKIETFKPDVVFNLMEIFRFIPKLESNVAGILSLLKVPYTGATPQVLRNCQDKVMVKRILGNNGIKTASFIVTQELISLKDTGLKLPLILKPAYEDSSVGIENASVIREEDKFILRLEYMLKRFLQPIIIEEFIEGRELNVAIFGYPKLHALPISEIDFSAMPPHLENIVSYEAKWDEEHEAYHKSVGVCPADLPKNIEKKAKQTALNAGRLMGINDYARVDMRLTPQGELYVLEVNPNPDLTEGAGFMRSAHAADYSFADALDLIVRLAFRKKFHQ